MRKKLSCSLKRVLSLIMVLSMVLTWIPLTAFAADGKMIYFKPGSGWPSDGARFAVYYWNDSGNGWTSLEYVEDGVYGGEIPGDCSNVIFCRMNPAQIGNSWDAKWNQTANQTIPSGSNCFAVNEGEWDGANGTWSSYSTVEATEPEETTEPSEATETDYYLIGYINGADYGCEGDWENLGSYKFEDGKLTATFTQDSYVFIKTGDNANWYLFEEYCQDTSGTLKIGGSNKMFVPGNTELTFTLVENEDGTLTLSYAEKAAEPKTDYYLIGYINGADYGCEGDWENLGSYKFEDGKLTATFTQNSYVFIKTGDNANWYLFETYCEETSGTLKIGGSNKMFVPGNTELTFTLVENADGTLTLSYAEKTAEPETDYYLIGYINGADYGCESDWENLGSYKFEDGKLTATFTQNSYVFIKTGDNANWYLFETYCEETSGTLKIGGSEKMFVPGNTELTFTLVENEDGTLTLSYAVPTTGTDIPDGWTAVTIHFLKPDDWGSNIRVYTWGGDDNGIWPGGSISANSSHAGWYDYVAPQETPGAFNFIFNDGASQTSDLATGEVTGDKELWVVDNVVYETAPDAWNGVYTYNLTVHMLKPGSWEAPIQIRYGSTADPKFGYTILKGAMEEDDRNNGWYTYTISVEGDNSPLAFRLCDVCGNMTAELQSGTLQKQTHIWVVDGTVQTTAPSGWVDTDMQVYTPGTFPGPSWDAASNQMTFDAELGLFTYTFSDVPAGNYEFKIALNGSWKVNYGVGGTLNGANYSVSVPETMDVTVYYHPTTHNAVTNVDYVFADITLSGTGIPEGTRMTDPGLTGVYSAKVAMKAGTYTDVTITYRNKTYRFTKIVVSADKDVNFYMDPATDIFYCDASDIPIQTDKIYFNSQDSAYKSEFGAIATGEECTFAIDSGEDILSAVLVIKGVGSFPMTSVDMETGKRWSCTASVSRIGEYDYYFALSNGSGVVIYGDDDGYYGEGKTTDLANVLPYDLVVYKSGYTTPDWMKKAVIYQIFPDRFFDGDQSNNQAQTSARGDVQYEYVNNWYLWPENPEQEQMNPDQYPDQAYSGDGQWSNEIYGGDLKGIIERVDYLKALGVNVIYLNPVFSSISNHRYDTSDYTKIDPILGTMGDFEELVAVAEANDMHIIMDGVFNHVSDDSVYFDRYYKYLGTSNKVGAYPYWAYVYDYMAENGATKADAETAAKTFFSTNYGITDYSYTEWFEIYSTTMTGAVDTVGLRAGKAVYSYDGWWGYDSMPIIYATNGSEYQTGNWADEIIYNEDGTSVTQYWISKGNDGWRLDVANEVSDETWQKFRDSVKAMNDGDVVIIGEIWDDATKYLLGDMYDSVMNYMFRNAVTAFAKGASAEETMKALEKLRERYPEEAFYAMMNLVGSHDTSRLLSYLDGIDDDRTDKTPSGAYPSYDTTSDLAKKRQFLVAFLQFTYPGAPTIYYGDELGMVGSDDPDDRRAMEWGNGNQELVEWYANLALLRDNYPALSTGNIKPLAFGDSNLLAYSRSNDDMELIVIGNNSTDAKTVKVTKTNDENYVDLLTGKEFDGDVTVDGLRGVILVRKSQYTKYEIDKDKLAPAYDPAYRVDVSQRPSEAPETKYSTQDGQQVELGNSLSFTVKDALVNTYVKTLVDGKELNVKVSTGTTITLSADQIFDIGKGSHTIEIVFQGGSAKATFEVVEPATEAPTEEIPTEESTESTETTTETPETSESTESSETTTEPAGDVSAKTGDSSGIVLWVSLLILSAAALLTLFVWRKRSAK